MSFKTLDDLATWMLSNISLSRYDDEFINSLTMYIVQHGRITQNQHKLFIRVASKFTRQATKLGVDIINTLTLSWSVPIVESIPSYTSASIKIENNIIYFRSPFKRSFIVEYKKNPIYLMKWDPDNRYYSMPFSQTSLRDLIYMASDHFEEVTYCPITLAFIEQLSEYETMKYWSPTLTYNGLYCVKAINNSLFEAIKHIELSDNLSNIATLVKYGIKIDDSVVNRLNAIYDPAKVDFATTFHPEIESMNLKNIANWLTELGSDGIITDHYTLKFLRKIKSTTELHLSDIDHGLKNPTFVYFKGVNFIRNINAGGVFKIVRCVHSAPVDLGTK